MNDSARTADAGACHVAAIAGRRPDEPGAAKSRFPSSAVPHVQRAIRELFSVERLERVVSSAAAGADLLALAAARELGIPATIVLPFDLPAFRKVSVADRGPVWARQFDEIVSGSDADIVYVDEPFRSTEAAFRAVTTEIVVRSQLACPPGGSPLAVAVWDGEPTGRADMTAFFISEATQRHFRVLQLSTTGWDA